MSLKKHFYDAASPECQRENGLYKPAAAFAIKNGITGIATYYTYPNNMTASEFENYRGYTSESFACYVPPRDCDFQQILIKTPPKSLMDRMNKEWDGLVKLNPWLSQLKFDRTSPYSLHNAIEGVACQLNLSDIQHFISVIEEHNRWDVYRIVFSNPEYAEKMERANKLAPTEEIRWVPAPQTLDQIINKLEAKYERKVGTQPQPS
ncbi:MAG: hypothetical protein QF692_08805 [Alphaproteobacteria bacterium]|jgi:hypothetical protein|nr:hypothetical protein [Alphaproteobacteria bacterium]MDP7223344.1 hypothetical protein [Alphaproteobacteria bacterium]